MDSIEPSLHLKPRDRIRVDWSDLPVEMLQEISDKLHDIFDFVHFRAVCKKWREAISISDLPPQLPWILEERENVKDRDSQSLRFYSLFSDKIRTIHCPPACGKYLYGPSHGYLYSFDLNYNGPTHSLMNPLTKDEVTIEIRRHSDPYVVCMGPDPIRSNNYMSFRVDFLSETMGFYHPRTCEWNYVEVPVCDWNAGHACLRGAFYINKPDTGATVVVNIACDSSFVIPPPKTPVIPDFVYFVESAGKILRIVPFLDLNLASPFCLDIFQLDVKDEIDQSRWVNTNSIGNQILFLDESYGISITASPSTGLNGNCVYYLLGSEVYKYNISDGQAKKVLSFVKRKDLACSQSY
ncbi:hypothetical protein LUZ61_009944 [Rhynchospora tenuis]|uniref:F-box domain-containing protein n=1 Tax=Rhynchospora tenuis TaxID=198213 RepID=A0AAD6EYW7_9POAL|nr:hypothetical protein LUZ61_009944 [Rhynchospora tenuis]